jgi:hypothetical protein
LYLTRCVYNVHCTYKTERAKWPRLHHPNYNQTKRKFHQTNPNQLFCFGSDWLSDCRIDQTVVPIHALENVCDVRFDISWEFVNYIFIFKKKKTIGNLFALTTDSRNTSQIFKNQICAIEFVFNSQYCEIRYDDIGANVFEY